MSYNLRKPKVLVVFLLTLVFVTIAAGQENKNRRGRFQRGGSYQMRAREAGSRYSLSPFLTPKTS